MEAIEVRKSVCPRDCPDVCSMIAQVENGEIVRVVGDPDHPITRGFLCGRFQHYEELINHPARLLHPLAREKKTEPFERASWDDALDLIANRWREIVERHGPEAILPYRYLGNMGILGTHYADRLWNAIGTSRVGMEICAIAGIEAVLEGLRSAAGCRAATRLQDEALHRLGQESKGDEHPWMGERVQRHPPVRQPSTPSRATRPPLRTSSSS